MAWLLVPLVIALLGIGIVYGFSFTLLMTFVPVCLSSAGFLYVSALQLERAHGSSGAGYTPWSSMILIASMVGMGSVLAGSKKAKRLKAIRRHNSISASFAKSVENFIDNILLISLPLLAVGLLSLHWQEGLSGSVIDLVLYPSLIVLCVLTSLGFYIAQLPTVFPDRRVKAYFQ